MKKTELKNYILDHAHLVLNERKEYLDGQLVVRDGRIVDLQAQTREVREEYADLPAVDLKGQAVLPLSCAFLLPYPLWKKEGEEALYAEGTGLYVLQIEKDIRFSLSYLKEHPQLRKSCAGAILRVPPQACADFLGEDLVLGFLLDPAVADARLFECIRNAGKRILFGASEKTFADGETVSEDILFADLLKSGELGIAERKILNLALEQNENYRVFAPQQNSLHLLKIVTGHFYSDRVIFELSGMKPAEVLKELRKEKIPFRQIAAYLGLNARRCLNAAEGSALQKGRSADLFCAAEDGRILFTVKDGVCYR